MKLASLARIPRPGRAGKLSLMSAAALALPLLMPPGAAPAAAAGDSRWSFTVSSHSGYHDRGRHYSRGYDRGYHSSGYYKRVWIAPVYRTRHDDCGRAFRVCVREGYYKRVFVRTSYHQPRYRDYHRRGQWGHSGSCRY